MIRKTRFGAVRGETSDAVSVFKGVPYAAALDGKNRFLPPQPPQPWDGVRPAHAFSAVPPQGSMAGTVGEWRPGDSTDCLTVNVWTPDIGNSRLPVMVWFYGGAFRFGGTSNPQYDGAVLAHDGVVVVTVNYRVGYEGYGWVEDSPANRGTLDQLAALHWIQDNIAEFGGDPDKVTIFGQSAGGTSVAMLVSSPVSAGLFQRAIVQSPSSRFYSAAESRRVSELILAGIGAPPTVAALTGVPPETIHAAEGAALAAFAADPSAWTATEAFTPYYPVIGDEVLPTTPWAGMRAGAGRGVDLIAGFTRDEFRLYAHPGSVTSPDITAHSEGLATGAIQAYREAHPGLPEPDLDVLIRSDALFRMPSLYCARSHARAGGRTFAYEFTFPSPIEPRALGAYHGIDVPFIFGSAKGAAAELIGSETNLDPLSRQIRTAWTSFARTGDPGWPQYRVGEMLTRIWHNPPTVESDPEAASRLIWQSHYEP
ncbi:carboxylesterase/lipase family protein [Nocardia brasiliensis]|uniref:Carboxylic ester hydrolase n=1 Tax=Nocardia brasiliensis (strain ATCC 700358 / HUJEG-1) TaxID=1133849 RepID=K0F5U7_NOCB7|nr:carboxylesterase family protein [Nocardia brasiliensis]AFU04705.1 para-nitrobenzyl esterase [Nocardia brasiliensis ATCC 700358]OCF88317.1 carboxylesterase [Nocardia brasiliensis]